MTLLRRFNILTLISALLALSLGVSACATRPPASDPAALAEYKRTNDPLEPLNRATFKFNMFFDRNVMRPIAIGYRDIVPHPVRNGISNFLDNLSAPFTLINEILQGEGNQAATTVMRFITNSTVGLVGILDPAKKWGYEEHTEDFGETLAVWGIGEGFYLVLPFAGPSNPRDTLGLGVRFFGDPTGIVITDEAGKHWSYARTGMEIIDFRSANIKSMDDLLANSADPYTAFRSAYRQNRAFRINNGKMPAQPADDDPFATDMSE